MSTNDDTQDEGGLEPALEDADVAVADAPEVEAAPEPETYTRDQLAELLPHFEQFASHEGPDAIREYGKSYLNARGLISAGGHRQPQDEDVYRSIGIDPAEIAQPEQDAGPGLFGVPWGEPTTWDEVDALAQSEHAEHKQRAAMAVLKSDDAPQEYKRAYWDNAYGQGSYDALSMQQQALLEQQAEMRQQLRDEILAELAPVQQAHTNTYVEGLLGQARSGIPGFTDHEQTIRQLMVEREQRFPGYQQNFNTSNVEAQLDEFRELTLIASSRAAPQRKAAQAQASQDTDAAKLAARTETSRTSGAPESDADARRRAERAVLKRIGGTIR